MVTTAMSVPVVTAAILSVIFQTARANNPPQFSDIPKIFSVAENKSVGSVLFNLTAVDDDLPADKTLTFTVEGEIANNLLKINRTGAKSADVVLKSPLDRETADKYDLVFYVSDGVSQNAGILMLLVSDVNDNPPRFINTKFSLDVKEDTPVGSILYTVSATDPDTGYGGTVRFALTVRTQPGQPTDLFSINGANGSIVLLKPLDYEQNKIYQLDIMAEDFEHLNSTTVLVIYVRDVQDTPPVFFSTPYTANVPENSKVGTDVIQLFSQDGDIEKGVSNPIKFKFTAGSNAYFNLNDTFGWISVAKNIDREEPTLLQADGLIVFNVTAYEDTTHPMGVTETSTEVRITVTDVDDNTPTFSATNYNATVKENTQKAVPVTFLPLGTEMVVTDRDKGDNGKFQLSIEQDGQPYDAFEASPSSVIFNEANVLIRVKNSSVLDFETTREIKFQIVARETSTELKLSSTASITLAIEDVNDFYPVFANQTYQISLPENSPKGTSVATVTATDGDRGTFGELTYSLKGVNSDKFTVDPKTGLISTSKDADKDLTILDRETLDTYYVTYEAVDGGNFRETTQLEIKLTDVNDNAPVFLRSVYDDGMVRENFKEMERELKVEARDRDLPPNSDIVYSIVAGDPDGNFTIDPNTGVVNLTGPLDYEKLKPGQDGRFNLTVMAKDKGIPPLNETVNVIITVEDENDNSPYFNATKFTIDIAENAKPGSTVTSVAAKDDDLAGTANAELIYRIETGALDKFRIDGQTGVVTVESGASLDRDKFQKNYTLTVVAIDRGTPPLTGTVMLDVQITDVNNKRPTFDTESMRIRVQENATMGTVVYTYKATDLDTNANLVYSLNASLTEAMDENGREVDPATYDFKGLFDVYATNGSIYTKAALDREHAALITLGLIVNDTNALDPQPQTATATLMIDILDVNDNPPVFQPSNRYNGSMSESAQIGDQIIRVVALDRDRLNVVKYRIDTDVTQSVEIKNDNDGLVTLKKTVDRETTDWLNFTVVAYDSGVPPLSSTAMVELSVKDVNDNSPSFVPQPAVVTVPEDAELNRIVMTVKAVDRDTGTFASILYTMFAQPSDGSFQINQTDGVIRLVKKLDRETVAAYTLTITAADNNGVTTADAEPRKTDTTVTVKVTDVNDNAPKFASDKFTKLIQETSPVNEVIATYTALDIDEGDNASILYTFDPNQSNGTALFSIDVNNGNVIPKVVLTDHIGCYQLQLVATDKGKPPLQGTSQLIVCVEDLNNNPPRIVKPPDNNTTFLITEGAAAGSFITQIVAEDPDTGPTNILRFEFAQNLADQKKYWSDFNLNPVTGNITTTVVPDHEKIPLYYLQVVVKDGTFEARRDIQVKVVDVDDNLPLFDITIEIPFPMEVIEEAVPSDNGYVGTVPGASDPDEGSNSNICYYIVGGDDPNMIFRLDRETRKLYITQKLDREALGAHVYIDLVIKATHICADEYDRTKVLTRTKRAAPVVIGDKSLFEQPFNRSDKSLMLVRVTVDDINDSPPEWLIKSFNAGVTRDTQIYSEVYDFKPYARDNDTGPNAVMNFYIVGDINITPPLLKQQVEEKLSSHKAFTLQKDVGKLLTNMFFEASMVGYFDFKIIVNDSSGHQDTATVSVYLLNDNQRVKVVFRDPVSVVGNKRDAFAKFLTEVIPEAKIIVDKISTYKSSEGISNDKLTDMFIHAVDNQTGKILEARQVLDLIDRNYDHLEAFFKDYNVIQVVLAVDPVPATNEVSNLRLALIVVAIVLLALLIFLCLIFICCRRKYRRKLKAATAMAFGPADGHLSKVDLPGTNLHAYEGSNPIWLETHHNPPSRGEDFARKWYDIYARRKSCKNSLDDDDLEPNSSANKAYDEQEITLDLYNDEYDSFNKIRPPEGFCNGGYLGAVLAEHDAARNNNNADHARNGSLQNGKGTFGPASSGPLGSLETTEI